MRTDTSPVISRNDYRPYGYTLLHVHLCFDLDHNTTRVRAEMDFERASANTEPLVLYGQDLNLTCVCIDGKPLDSDEYKQHNGELTLNPNAERFTVTVHNECHPASNTTLMGLYTSGDKLFTQCEAEGFRRITWFPDRPDVMSAYRVTLRADKSRYPILLSNGNLVSQSELDDGRHEAVWEDPYPKPSYLFALVAGQFDCREKSVKTRSGRPVRLQVYSDVGTKEQTEWALACLERAMRWDEQCFGLELDLDRFMIVAARDFNMGAMENKGLNVFNSTYVLASSDSATDATYRAIEAVIGHEYFHNWTGNRVTCRDWFQLSLKEGLTVFREQEFSADMLAAGLEGAAAQSARAVKRIEDVDILRSSQFPEDAGPMAHPIRPESYHEISNFYTATIYEKGAEVIRMLHTLLGPSGFRQGIDEYFRRHDGQAVTCDDFIDAMQVAYGQKNLGQDLEVFRRWYSQAGTPRVKVNLDYDGSAQRCTITLSQHSDAVGVEKLSTPSVTKPPLHIPVSLGFLRSDGKPMLPTRDSPSVSGTEPPAQTTSAPETDDPSVGANDEGTVTLDLTDTSQSWSFRGVSERPILSLLRSFSAPIIVEYQRTDDELAVLAQHDPDPFARWEAVQQIATHEILKHVMAEHAAAPPKKAKIILGAAITRVWRSLIEDTALAADYRTRALTLISRKQMLLHVDPMDPVAVNCAHARVHAELGKAFADQWFDLYLANSDVAEQPYRADPVDAGKRALRSLALGYLLAALHPEARRLATQQYHRANNLTDRMGALQALTRYAPKDASADVLADFYRRAQDDEQIMDAWFNVQANACWASVDSVRTLMARPEFSLRNPNRARSLIFQFCLNNLAGIHTSEGYDFWAEQILALDALNPEISARLARGLDNWASFTQPAKNGMYRTLQQIHAHKSLSPNVQEIVDKALNI